MDYRNTVIWIAWRSNAVKVCNRRAAGAPADATAAACTKDLKWGAPNRNRRASGRRRIPWGHPGARCWCPN